MKYDAIVDQGIAIHERVPIPDELIPEDSRVEIDAKINAGYCRFTGNPKADPVSRKFAGPLLKTSLICSYYW